MGNYLIDCKKKNIEVRRYLVVIDVTLTERSSDDIKLCFPDCNRECRILLTTRNMKVVNYASSGKSPVLVLRPMCVIFMAHINIVLVYYLITK